MSLVISNNIFGNSRQKHHYQNIFTFWQSGNPLILIIFPEFFSASFQFKSWTFLYFSIPRVSSTRTITYSLDNSKIFLNYLLIPLIFVLHTNYPLIKRKGNSIICTPNIDSFYAASTIPEDTENIKSRYFSKTRFGLN